MWIPLSLSPYHSLIKPSASVRFKLNAPCAITQVLLQFTHEVTKVAMRAIHKDCELCKFARDDFMLLYIQYKATPILLCAFYARDDDVQCSK